ncbi:MAG: hypothetical protein QOF89_4497 [Acidobacteriota bacterium]|jgi:hypothetical protein|nr:hypothetical protein [Acidobacteriota bacterium]
MTEQRAGNQVMALWLIAAVLALGAAAVRYFVHGEVMWYLIGAGLFCAVMGIGAGSRSRGSGT